MKKYLINRILCAAAAAAVIVQSMTAVAVSAAETLPSYAKAISFSTGEQGNGGWYYMYKDTSTGEYVNMTWNGSQFNGGGGNVNTHFIMPGYGTPSVIGFEVPYTGTVTLKVTDNVIYRSSANSKGGDVAATLKLNNDELWTHTFDNTCYNTTGKTSVYVKENVSVKKGDMIYHEVDCGTNTTSADLYWKPQVIYTAVNDPDYNGVTEFKMATDIKASDQQGYNGWYYMYQTSTGYVNMDTRTSEGGGKWQQAGNFISGVQSCPEYNTPTIIGWQAPYTGTVTLSHLHTVYREGSQPSDTNPGGTPTGGNIEATIELNNNKLWSHTFDNTCYNGGDKTTTYNITNVHVNQGDIIYHEVDCGTNTNGNYIYWKPIVTYTEMEVIPDKTQTVYKKTVSYPVGAQGYHGWYFYKKNITTNEYVPLKWDSSQYKLDDTYVNEHFALPGSNAPSVIAWKAPYTGTVKLTHQDTVYRDGAPDTAGDITATIKLDNDELWSHTFDKTCSNTPGKTATYTIQDVHVNKGDVIYHEVDCGTNTDGRYIYWKPIVEYTAFDNTSYTQTTSPAITGSDEDKTGFVTTINAVNDISISNIRWNVTSGERTKLLTPTGSCPITTLNSGASVSFKVIVNGLKDDAATAVAVVE